MRKLVIATFAFVALVGITASIAVPAFAGSRTCTTNCSGNSCTTHCY